MAVAGSRGRGKRPKSKPAPGLASGSASLFGEGTVNAVPAANVVGDAIYVSLTGNDTTGNGAIGSPYRSLAKASTVVQPGDTVYLRGGYYDVLGTDSYRSNTYWGGSAPELTFSGTEAAPITVRSYPGEWAVIDGINHPDWPKSFVSSTDIGNPDAYNPYLLIFTGSWVNWENLEFRNGVGGGVRAFMLDSRFTRCIFQHNHAVGLRVDGSRNEVSYCLFQDNYSCTNDGASANGAFFSFSSGSYSLVSRFPSEAESGDNVFRYNVARNNSDDGLSFVFSVRSTAEYNVVYENGYGASGDGVGIKTGFSGGTNTGSIARFNLVWGNSDIGMHTNYGTGITMHNNTVWDAAKGSFGFWVTSQAGSGDNEGYNNLSLSPQDGVHRYYESGVTVHEGNAGYPGNWIPVPPNLAAADPLIMSYDPTSANFLKLGSGSPYIGAGVTVTGGNTTLGAIPDGQDFAGGWNWRALVNAYPSNGLRSRTPMYPMAQGTRTPYPDGSEEQPVANAIYVSLTGDNTTGDGSLGNPYRSLTKAVAEVVAGQTIYLRGGTYDTPGTDAYYTDLGGGAGERAGYLDLRGKATSSNRIAIRSYPGELAVIDGYNSSLQPRGILDGLDPEEPYLMKLIGEYVDISHMTFKRSAGKGLTLFGNHCTVKNVLTCSHHSDGLYIQGEENVIENLDSHHNYGVATGGNNGDGVKMLDYGNTMELFFGAGARTRNNTFRRCRFWLNSDDGIDTWNAPGTVLEDCVSFNNGYDSNGNGMGYKFGQSSLRNAGNIARRCISVRNKSDNFTTNGATGVTFEWCTSYQPYGEMGFYFKADTAAQDGSDGYNYGRNNVSYDATYVASPTVSVPTFIVYQNNTWNLSISNPSFASVTPSNADFLELSSGSGCIDAATDGTDLGAIQFGGAFPVPMTPCSMSFSGGVPLPYTGSDAYPDWE